MSKEKKKKNEQFDAFLEKEILTANRYDGSAKEEEEEKKGLCYEDAGIDGRILRAVKELGPFHRFFKFKTQVLHNFPLTWIL